MMIIIIIIIIIIIVIVIMSVIDSGTFYVFSLCFSTLSVIGLFAVMLAR